MRLTFNKDKGSAPKSRHFSHQNTQSQLNEKLEAIAFSMNQMNSKFDSYVNEQKKNSKQFFSTHLKTLMEERDQSVVLEAPKLSEDEDQRVKQIKLWLGQVSEHVFSVTFNFFFKKLLRTQKMKSFCSESFIGNIIELSKVNQLTKHDFELMNDHLTKDLLPYYLLRYPQTDSRQINQSLAHTVQAINSIDNNENNLIFKSKVKFVYHEDGCYDREIMNFINYLISIPSIKVEENLTMFQSFHDKMQKIFTSVEDKVWVETDLFEDFKKHEDVEQLKNQEVVLTSYITQRKPKKASKTQEEEENEAKKQYAEQVKSYTYYAINQKVSKNVPKFSQNQIMKKSFKIKHSSILRILTKWCGELEEKFADLDYFLDRDDSFVMMNGKEAEMNTEMRQSLKYYANQEWAKIQEFHEKIVDNNYKTQKQLSFKNLMQLSNNSAPLFPTNIIKFSRRITENMYNYTISYLNRLIHGLMTIAKQIFASDLKGWAQWPLQPFLLTFSVSDLLRCRCISKEKEIIRIYKQLEILNVLFPKTYKIVRVKNRLNRGTRDILLNIMLHNEALCQIQLGIKTETSDFILSSDKFNHLVYELKRSIFGPISQMASIWKSIDERSDLLKDDQIYFDYVPHKCTTSEQQYEKEILPFVCSKCQSYISQEVFILDNLICVNCENYWLCARCRLHSLPQQELKKILQKETGKKLLTRIHTYTPNLPQYCVSIPFQSSIIMGFEVKLFLIQKEAYFVVLEHGKSKILMTARKNSNYISKIPFEKFLIFQNGNPSEQIKNLHENDVLQVSVLDQISQCYKKKYQAIRIANKKITEEIVLKIRDPRSQTLIKTLSFPENRIKSMKGISENFPNVKVLNLNKNGLESLEGIGNMKSLTDVYLGNNKFPEIVEFSKLTELRYLQLGNNSSMPTIKCDLSPLKNLQTLTFISSKLTVFPTQVCNIQNLKLLWLFQNEIEVISPEIKKLRNLVNFQISKNKIKVLPNELFECRSLEILSLFQNSIMAIPENILELSNLKELKISHNPLESIPLQILKMETMEVVSVSSDQNNKFSLSSQQIKAKLQIY